MSTQLDAADGTMSPMTVTSPDSRPATSMRLSVLAPRVRDEADRLAAVFHGALPFQHFAIDGFFTEEFAARLLAEFPPFEAGDNRNEAGLGGAKAVFERVRRLGPAFTALDDLVRSAEFLALLGRITGIRDLRYDPDYIGGGTHENRHGQELDPHVDFNRHPFTRWHRRLNLIVYLNRDWRDEWGGSLELHSNPRAADD